MTKYVPKDPDSQNGITNEQYQDFIELMLKKQHGVDVDSHKMLMDDKIRDKVQKKGSVRLDNGLRFIKCTRKSDDYCCLFQVEGQWCCSGRCKPKKGLWKAMMMTDEWHWKNPNAKCSYRLCNKEGFDREKEAEYIYKTLSQHGEYERVEYESKNY